MITDTVNSPERWRSDLMAAGWVQVRHTIWRSPSGALYRGPYGAWCVLQACAQDTCECCGSKVGVRFRPDADVDLCDPCYTELAKEPV